MIPAAPKKVLHPSLSVGPMKVQAIKPAAKYGRYCDNSLPNSAPYRTPTENTVAPRPRVIQRGPSVVLLYLNLMSFQASVDHCATRMRVAKISSEAALNRR